MAENNDIIRQYIHSYVKGENGVQTSRELARKMCEGRSSSFKTVGITFYLETYSGVLYH